MLERRQCIDGTEVENPEETIGDSIKHAKDAILRDVQDGISWYALGNACFTAYFLTGTWDHDMLFQSLKAYRNAGKDKKMKCCAEFNYTCSMACKFLEKYQMALTGLEIAGLMDPSLKCLEQASNLCDVLDNIDFLLQELNDAKRLPSPASPLPAVDSQASILASAELDPSYERATVDRPAEGLNEGKAVTGKVLFSVKNPSGSPIYYVVCDSDHTCFVITVYGVCSTAIKEEDEITLLDPLYHFFDFEWKAKQYQFKSVSVDFLQEIRVNGEVVSPEHVIHPSMYADFMKGERKKRMMLEESRLPFSAFPWLLICHGECRENQTFFSISEARYYDRSIPELQNKMICAYAQDWLVLFDVEYCDCYLWNANSEEKIQLPPLPEDGYVRCLLSRPPDDPECCILFLIDESREDDIYVGRRTFYFCKPGYNEGFHKQEMQLDDDELGDWTVFNGKFYALMSDESILVLLDVDNDLGTITITPMVDQPAFDYCGYLDMPRSGRYLIQSSCGDDHMLLYLHKLYFYNSKELYGFFLFQFDFEEKAWKKLTSIGESAVFLSDRWGSGGITCSTRGANIKKDSIYFIERDDRFLYVYDLERKSMSISLPCPYVDVEESFQWLSLPSR
ncbi:PREDICTED: uncharacterized protein LOC109228925 isoform X2 [Nicotiana attenuata]|uniref:DUF295 domain-containing protein n=2 Tax=Nicotiana attenuata TaxID=49451 RepID=A0A1J6I5U4_NICAT|nr:PREDICTED: uncharacterized protein LOC109228925 isoform X2 [Nicotiana attenuata]OIT00398.1 hypothetical protein A4A49_11156 [Nicotiana attenuata]